MPGSPLKSLRKADEEIAKFKKTLCKIKASCGCGIGSGFLCEMPLHGRRALGLFTCNHVIAYSYFDSHLCTITDDNEHKPIELIFEGLKIKLKLIYTIGFYWFSCQFLDVTFIELSTKFVERLLLANAEFIQLVRTCNGAEGEEVVVFQHPDVKEVKYSKGKATAWGIRLRHGASTLKGSSGSPVLSSNYELIAIHHGHDSVKNTATVMEAVMDAIQEDSRICSINEVSKREPRDLTTLEIKNYRHQLDLHYIHHNLFFCFPLDQNTDRGLVVFFQRTHHSWYYAPLSSFPDDRKNDWADFFRNDFATASSCQWRKELPDTAARDGKWAKITFEDSETCAVLDEVRAFIMNVKEKHWLAEDTLIECLGFSGYTNHPY